MSEMYNKLDGVQQICVFMLALEKYQCRSQDQKFCISANGMFPVCHDGIKSTRCVKNKNVMTKRDQICRQVDSSWFTTTNTIIDSLFAPSTSAGSITFIKSSFVLIIITIMMSLIYIKKNNTPQHILFAKNPLPTLPFLEYVYKLK